MYTINLKLYNFSEQEQKIEETDRTIKLNDREKLNGATVELLGCAESFGTIKKLKRQEVFLSVVKSRYGGKVRTTPVYVFKLEKEVNLSLQLFNFLIISTIELTQQHCKEIIREAFKEAML